MPTELNPVAEELNSSWKEWVWGWALITETVRSHRASPARVNEEQNREQH